MKPGPCRLQRAIGCLLTTLALGASATTTVYRCGPDGRTWSQMPCPDGERIHLSTHVPAERTDQAREVAERDMALADSLLKERLKREATMRKEARDAAGFHTAPRAAPQARPAAVATSPKPKRETTSRRREAGTKLRQAAPAPAPSINSR